VARRIQASRRKRIFEENSEGTDERRGNHPRAGQNSTIRLRGAFQSQFTKKSDAFQAAANQARDFQKEKGVEISVGVYSTGRGRNRRYGFTNGRTTYERGRTSAVSGRDFRGLRNEGNIHSHPKNFRSGDDLIPLVASSDRTYANDNSYSFVVTPNREIWEISGDLRDAFYRKRSSFRFLD